MLRIDLLLSKDEKATQAIADALQTQIEKKLLPLYPELFIRVRVGSGKKCDISGIRCRDERAKIEESLEEIFYSDDWLPEPDHDDSEIIMQPKARRK